MVSQLPNKYAPPGPGVADSLMTVPPPLNLEDTAETSQQPAGNTLTSRAGPSPPHKKGVPERTPQLLNCLHTQPRKTYLINYTVPQAQYPLPSTFSLYTHTNAMTMLTLTVLPLIPCKPTSPVKRVTVRTKRLHTRQAGQSGTMNSRQGICQHIFRAFDVADVQAIWF